MNDTRLAKLLTELRAFRRKDYDLPLPGCLVLDDIISRYSKPAPMAEHPDLVTGTMPYAPKDERYCGIKYMVDILKKQIIKTDHDDLSEFGEGCIFFLKDMLDNAEMFYKEEKKHRHVKVEKEIDK